MGPSDRRAFRTLDTYNVNMPGQKRPSNTTVIALLNRYQCPTPFHAVRTRFMGTIASPLLDRSPLNVIHEIWGGELPPFDTVEGVNNLLDVLMTGLWNPLTAHQIESKPFKLTRFKIKQTREGLNHYALVRKQEIEGFMDGLFGSQEEIDLPESARDGVGVLGEMRSMLAGAITLLDDPGLPAAAEDLKGLSDNLQALAMILEKEMNIVLLSCTRARKQVPADGWQSEPTVH